MFVDFKKAYDSVVRAALCPTLQKLVLPGPGGLIRLLRVCQEDAASWVRGPQGLSEPINITTALKQGHTLSPLLFNLPLEGVLRGMRNAALRTHPFDADGDIVELPGNLATWLHR